MTAIVKDISVHPKYRRRRVVGIFDDLDAEHRRKNPSKPRVNHSRNGQTGYVKRNDFGLPAFLAAGIFENFPSDPPGRTRGLPDSHPHAGITDRDWNELLNSLDIDPNKIF